MFKKNDAGTLANWSIEEIRRLNWKSCKVYRPVHHSTEVSHERGSFSSIVFVGMFCSFFVVWNYVKIKSHWECKSLRCTSPWCLEVETPLTSSESLAGWVSRGRWFGTKLSQSDPHAMLRCCLPPSRQDDKQKPEGTVQNHLSIAVKRLLDGHHMSSWINKVKIRPWLHQLTSLSFF